MIFRHFNLVLCLCFAFVLASCITRTDITSTVTLGQDVQDVDLQSLIKRVKDHMEALGSICKESDKGAVCRFSENPPEGATDINVGTTKEDGRLYVAVHSDVSRLFPIPTENVLDDDVLPAQHRELERWLIMQFPLENGTTRKRRASGREIEVDF
jgi:hypothetical protein